MTSYDVGPLRVLVSERAVRVIDVTDFDGTTHSATETPAACAGPGGLLLELAIRRWEAGGHVICLSRGDSPPTFDRLLHGGRMGVQVREDGTDWCELGLMRWQQATGWGNVGRADSAELDSLGAGDVWTLLTGLGALGVDSRAALFEDSSRRRNYLAAQFPASDSLVPIAAYVLTRVLPAVGREAS